MGALIIEDRPDIHGIPDQIANMPEIVLTIQVTVSTWTKNMRPITGCDVSESLEVLICVSLVVMYID